VFVENSPMLTARGIDVVLGGLAESGYNAEWGVLSASAVGAPHRRERLWILAKKENESAPSDTQGDRRHFSVTVSKKAFAQRQVHWGEGYAHLLPALPVWKGDHTGLQSMGDGVPFGMEQLRAIGNAQVPLCAAIAFASLYNRINNRGTASSLFS